MWKFTTTNNFLGTTQKLYNTLSTYNLQKVTTADPFITSYVFLNFFADWSKSIEERFLEKEKERGEMDPQWLGPYEVTKDLGKGFYTLSDPNTGFFFVRRVNGSHLKTYLTSSSQRADDSVAVPPPQV